MGNKMDKVIFPTSDYIEISPPTKSLCGSIASFSDGGNAPIPSLKVSIEPQQDLHGYDAPWVGGSGYNKWDEEWELGEYNTNTGTNYPSSSRIRTKNFVPVLPSTTYYMKCSEGGQLCQYDENKTFISGLSTNFSANSSITTSPTTKYIKFSPSGNYGTTYHNDIAVNYPSSITTYSPYSNICPISGWDEVNVTRCGKNLITEVIEGMDLISATGDARETVGWYLINYIRIEVGKTYFLSGTSSATVCYYDKHKTFTRTALNTRNIVPQEGECYVRCNSLIDGYSEPQIEEGTEATAFSPFGTTYTIDLDGTRYGGTLDVVSGVMTVDRIFGEFDGVDEDWGNTGAGSVGNRSNALFNAFPSTDIDTNFVTICNTYEGRSYNNRTFNHINVVWVNPNGSLTVVTDSDIDTAEKFKALLQNTPLQVIAKLATPLTVQLTPTQVNSLLGVNNIWADCGDVCVTYITQEYQDLAVNFAATASKLGSSNVGSATNPIYLASGTATACTYSLNKTVPSDAVFTDTAVTQTATDTGNATYELLFSGTADNTTRTEGARKSQYATFNPDKKAFTFGARKSDSTVGSYSHAEGYHTTASGNYSHAEGASTTASGNYSHAEGGSTTASSYCSHAEGSDTTASSYCSHAEGSDTTASGDYSHAEGYFTKASGDYSHAEGRETIASGNYSHTEGRETTANHRSQHVFGEYNISDDSSASSTERGNYIEIVGKGDSDSPSNARTLDWDGNEWLAGTLTTADVINSTNWDGTNTSLKDTITAVNSKVDNKNAGAFFISFNNATVKNSTITNLGSHQFAAGNWLIEYFVAFSSNATGFRRIIISNTSTGDVRDRFAQMMVPAISGTETRIHFVTIQSITADATLYFNAVQNSGSNLTASSIGVKGVKLY